MPLKTFAVLCAIALPCLLGSSLPAAADEKPRLYLAWHAPYGAPGATDTAWAQPGDGGRDTLFLAYETGADWPNFHGLTTTLYFRCAAGDSLLGPWQDESRVEVSFVRDSIPGYPRSWRGNQSLAFSYWNWVRGSASLKISNIRPPTDPVPALAGKRYAFARVMIDHPLAGEPQQPICVEWATAEFVRDSLGENSVNSGRGGHPFVSLNSRGGQVCEPFRPSEYVSPFRPPPQAAEGKRKSGSKKRK